DPAAAARHARSRLREGGQHRQRRRRYRGVPRLPRRRRDEQGRAGLPHPPPGRGAGAFAGGHVRGQPRRGGDEHAGGEHAVRPVTRATRRTGGPAAQGPVAASRGDRFGRVVAPRRVRGRSARRGDRRVDGPGCPSGAAQPGPRRAGAGHAMTSRTAKWLAADVPVIAAAHFEAEADRYGPDNPRGYVNLGTAENRLGWGLPAPPPPVPPPGPHIPYWPPD